MTAPADLPPSEDGLGGPRPALPEETVRALTEVSAFGPYFAVSTGEPAAEDGGAADMHDRDPAEDGSAAATHGRSPVADADTAPGHGSGWRPLGDLAADTALLRARIADHGRRLGTGEERVAASILYQGLAARLWSPVVGMAAAAGLVPATAGDLRWRPAATGPLPLWSPPTARWLAVPGGAARQAEAVYRVVMGEVLEPLAAAVGRLTAIAPALLRGNASAALAGVLKTVPPALGGRSAQLVRELLAIGALDGTGELAEPAPGAYFFVRRSCCLYYRVPGGGLCEDCALLPQKDRDLAWARASGREGAR
ncbi:(2Fe-2S)-binding protein [Sphaerisporangium aureirubrum]|uniref:(2Fe-2S)-binding protein n=1 Tax=Sphaerisporangium aureirubrum TaxID=1544736 RepID=A0ABW1NCZ8_9ACTN